MLLLILSGKKTVCSLESIVIWGKTRGILIIGECHMHIECISNMLILPVESDLYFLLYLVVTTFCVGQYIGLYLAVAKIKDKSRITGINSMHF